MRSGICFLGGARYSQPLDETSAKKFRALKSLGELFVIGFSRNLYPYRFFEHAHFYLLPRLFPSVLRYVEMFTLGPLLALWLIFRHNVRVLIAQSPYEGFPAALAKEVARVFGYRVMVVVESHGDFEESIFLQRRILFPGIYRFLMHRAASFALRHAELLRAISNSTRQQLERWAPKKPIIQFPTWTDIEVFLQVGSTEKESFRHEILYAGVLIRLKGIHHLIHAFASILKDFPSAKLLIVGREDDPGYVAELREQIILRGLDANVQFLKEMTQVELAAFMHQASVFVLPSQSEGLGRVVIEAMATRTPVIGSNVGGIPDMVEDGTNGFLVPSGDEAALAERLRWMLRHPDEVCRMGERARTFAKTFFSTEVYIKGYRQIFEIAQAPLTGPDKHAHSPF